MGVEIPLLPEVDYDQFQFLLFVLPLVLKAKTVMETGLHLGNSTRIFLEASRIANFTLYTFDVQDYPETRQKLMKLGLTGKWVFTVKDSVQAGREWSGEKIDILFLDSHHSYEHVLNELKAWTPHLSKKAVILCHDTNPTLSHDMYKTGGPLKALKQFVQENSEWKLVNLTYPEGLGVLFRNEQ